MCSKYPVTVMAQRMSRLTTNIIKAKTRWTLKLGGELNASTAGMMQLAGLLSDMQQANAEQLVIDLAALNVIDAYGLGLLLNAKRDFANGDIQIVLKNPGPRLCRLLRIMQFDQIFAIETDYPE